MVGTTTTGTLTIANTGSGALTVTGLTGPSGYTTDFSSGTIAAGASRQVTIGFSPTVAGDYSGTIAVLGNQTSGQNSIPVSGTASENVVGVWNGSLTISAANLSNVCTLSWIVTGESSDGTFTGTWQSSGGTLVACGQGGQLQGRATSTNAITNLAFNAVVGASSCAIVGGSEVMTGNLTGANSITAQTFDVMRCPGLADVSRSLTISMHKQ